MRAIEVAPLLQIFQKLFKTSSCLYHELTAAQAQFHFCEQCVVLW